MVADFVICLLVHQVDEDTSTLFTLVTKGNIISSESLLGYPRGALDSLVSLSTFTSAIWGL